MSSKTGLGLSIGRNNSSINIIDENDVSLFRRFKVANFTAFEKKTFLALAVHGQEGLKDLENDLFHALSLLGKGYNDFDVQTNLKSMPFKVLELAKGVKIIIQGKEFTPEEILTKIIFKLKYQIDRHVVHIPKAVVTYPVSFNREQQKSIEDTCKDEGLNVLCLLDEHTAAACNHLIPEAEKLKILFFDLSRRTFHASLFSKLNPSKVDQIQRVTRGRENFGGDTFAKTLLEYCLDEFKTKKRFDLRKVHKNETLQKKQEEDLISLKKRCEAAMIALSSETSCEVSLQGRHGIVIERSRFEAINQGNFQICLDIIAQVLEEGKASKSMVQNIILDGKTCQMPRIQQLLKEYFGAGVQFYYSSQIDAASSFAATLALGDGVVEAPIGDTSGDQDLPDSVDGVANHFRTERVPLIMDTLKRLSLNTNKPKPKKRASPTQKPQEKPKVSIPEEVEDEEIGMEIAESPSNSNATEEFEELLRGNHSRHGILMEVIDVIYADSMDKLMAVPAFIEPKLLQENHEISIQLALKTLSKLTPLTQELMQAVKSSLEKTYEVYKAINQQKRDAKGPAIGIDLGTTFCCAAYFKEEQVHIIPNDMGRHTTPSYVAFPEDGEVIVGEQAKIQAWEQSQNAIFDVKRLIGRSLDDEKIQSLKQYWPFDLFEENRKVKIQAGKHQFFPEEIITKLIAFIKNNAEEHFGEKVINAVITVPAYFNDRQRSLTKEACKNAGLNVLQLLNEPTAAALAYRLHKKDDKPRHCLIFDLGGGTFDLALLHIRDRKIHIKAIDGDPYMGGEDFDNIMVQYCINEFKKQHGMDISQEGEKLGITKRLRRLKMECEKQKVLLSSLTCKQVVVSLDAIYKDIDLAVKCTREVFESLIEDKMQKCMTIVDRALGKVELSANDISEVVLVGGSSRIPRIQEVLTSKFPSSSLAKTINADEAVASGAAILASFVENPELPNISIQECDHNVWI